VLATKSSANTELLIYAPSGGDFTVKLPQVQKQFDVEWMNPATGVNSIGKKVTGGKDITFSPPFKGDAVLYLKLSK
jgi:hypothetical protein